MKMSILFISQGFIHPSVLACRALYRVLLSSGEFNLQQAASLEALTRMPLEKVQAVVLYFHQRTISAKALDCLEQYLSQGGGCLAVHSASASFKQEPHFAALLGGRFDHHGPVEEFTIFPYLSPDPIFQDILPFSLKDERYLHVYDPGNTIHFASRSETGLEPLVWTRAHGQGRVCYCAAGHTLSSLRRPEIQQILLQGLRWCAGVKE